MKLLWQDPLALIMALGVYLFAVWAGQHPDFVELIILGAAMRVSVRIEPK